MSRRFFYSLSSHCYQNAQQQNEPACLTRQKRKLRSTKLPTGLNDFDKKHPNEAETSRASRSSLHNVELNVNIILYYFQFRSAVRCPLRKLFGKFSKEKLYRPASLSDRLYSFFCWDEDENLWPENVRREKRHMTKPSNCRRWKQQSSLLGGIVDPICKWYLRKKWKVLSMKLNTFLSLCRLWRTLHARVQLEIETNWT